MSMKIKWLSEPRDSNYNAAKSYLELHFYKDSVLEYVGSLRNAEMTEFMAKDILRASGLSLLGTSNATIKSNMEKIENNKPLSPILLMRHNFKLYVADGYHRLCAVHRVDEEAWIPCKII